MKSMPSRIEPFHALLYNLERCGSLQDVIAPPYDLIDEAAQRRLYERSPYNIVRIELARETDRYQAAADTLQSWRREGILTSYPKPALYLYSQKFESRGRRLARHAIMARFQLEAFSFGRILPHEKTFPKAKEDRLRLLDATKANISPIFGLYGGRHPELAALIAATVTRAPLLAADDEAGISNELRPIDTPDQIATIQAALANTQVLIADGHHRYETALEYRQRRRAAEGNPTESRPYDYVMMGLVACDDPGLVILPTHRIAHRLDPHVRNHFSQWAAEMFEVEPIADRREFLDRLERTRPGAIGVMLRGNSKYLILRMRSISDTMAQLLPDSPPEYRELDVTVLHVAILERGFAIDAEQVRAGSVLTYTIDADAALDRVARGEADGAFLLNPPSIREVELASEAGVTMPEKSTYFYPKLATGFVINCLE
jgi:uncharacterized protein (DUF1015 family)